MNKISLKAPKIDSGQLLPDEQLQSIEGGACSESCKQACLPGNMNGTHDGPDVTVDLDTTLV
jgi:hypothetical protein